MIVSLRFVSRFVVGVVAIVGLGACATHQQHDWHDGAPETAAQFTTAPTVLLETINDRRAEPAFIGQTQSYLLAPGHYRIMARYADFFEKSADEFERITSHPVQLVFVAEAGKTYRIEHPEVRHQNDARAFAEHPQLSIVHEGSGRPVQLRPEDPRGLSADRIETTAQHDVVELLKASWQRASIEQREAFLRWLQENR